MASNKLWRSIALNVLLALGASRRAPPFCLDALAFCEA